MGRYFWINAQFSQKSGSVPLCSITATAIQHHRNAGKFSDNRRMSTHSTRPWALYLVTFLTALLAAFSAVYWVFGVAGVAGQRTQASSAMVAPPVADAKDLARALGGDLAVQAKPVETTSTQYQLLGVVAGPVGKGYALMVVGSAPPKAYTVGSELGDGQVLQSVSARGARIGRTLQGEAAVELSLPKLPGA